MSVEAPGQKRNSREKPRGETCLNCAKDIETRFCPHCGQENAPPDLSLKAVLHEFFAELVYYDSKVWRTLRTLVAYPGRLSNEWSSGRRAQFLSPVRLYLTVTFLFFVSAAWHKPTGVVIQTGNSSKNREAMFKELSNSPLSPMERYLAEQQEGQLKLTPAETQKYVAALDQGSKRYDDGIKNGTIKPPSGWIEHQVEKLEAKAGSDPKGLTGLYISEIPKVLFVVLPLLAIVLKVLYWRQKRTFVEHLVFLLHFHSFAFLILLPVAWISADWMKVVLVTMMCLWIPGYAFVAMLRFYRQPWWLTLLKSWVLGFNYLLLSLAGALLALVFVVASLDDTKPNSKPAPPEFQSSRTP